MIFVFYKYIFNNKNVFFNISVLLFKIFLADFCHKFVKYLIESYCWKDSQGLQHQIKKNLSLQNFSRILLRKVSSSNKNIFSRWNFHIKFHIFELAYLNLPWYNFLSWSGKTLALHHKFNVSTFAPFPSACFQYFSIFFCLFQYSHCFNIFQYFFVCFNIFQ